MGHLLVCFFDVEMYMKSDCIILEDVEQIFTICNQNKTSLFDMVKISILSYQGFEK